MSGITNLLVEEIARLVEVPQETIDIDTPLTKIGIDSLHALQLVVFLERNYKVQIEESDLQHFTTVGNIATFINQLLPGAGSQPGIPSTVESYQ